MTTTNDLVRIDETGTIHPVTHHATSKLRAREGIFRLMPGPSHVVFMRYVGEDGHRDPEDGAVVRLSGEIVAPGTLCDVLALVGGAGWAGELVVLDGASSRSIFFEGGNVIAAQSTAEGERLAEIMFQFGAVGEADLARLLEKSEAESRRVGDVAVELGLVTREKLFSLVGKQTEEIVYNTMLTADGMFYFLDKFDEGRLTSRHNFHANGLLMEGVRRMDELSYFKERVPSEEHVPVRQTTHRALEEEVRDVYDAIDDKMSVAELGRRCEMSVFDVTRAVFQLASTGHVKVIPPRPKDHAAILATFNAAMTLVFGAVGDAGRAAELDEGMASFATSSGLYDHLFRGAGPHPDGTVDVDAVGKNLRTMSGDDDATALSQWLYEYVSFALFASASLLDEDREAALSRSVAEVIGPLRQAVPSDDPSPSGVMFAGLDLD